MAFIDKSGFNSNAINHYMGEASSITQQASLDEQQGNVRLIKWLNAWELYKDNWLVGVGSNNWLIEYPIYHQIHGFDKGVRLDSQSDHTHNDFIQLAVELGLVGVIILLWILVIFVKTLWPLLWSAPSQSRYLSVAIAAALLGISIDALFSFPLQLPLNIFLLMTYIGTISTLSRLHATKPEQEKTAIAVINDRPQMKLASTISAALVVFSAILYYFLVSGRNLVQESQILITRRKIIVSPSNRLTRHLAIIRINMIC